MSNFVVTAAHLRYIALHAMGLREEDECENAAWLLGGKWCVLTFSGRVSLFIAEGSFTFRDTPEFSNDVNAWHLLGWLVMDRGWGGTAGPISDRLGYLAFTTSSDGPKTACGSADTLCETIFQAILASSGWEEKG
jgi:hypothetical protein